MIRLLSLIVLISFSALNLAEESDPIPTQLIHQSHSNPLAYTLLSDLTTNIGPRQAGTEADLRAVKWAQQTLEAQGFDRVYQQAVNIPVWRRGTNTAQIITPAPQPLIVRALGYSIATPPEGITANILQVSSLEALQAVSSDSVRGTIVFIDQQLERVKNSESFRQLASKRSEMVSLAAQKGAQALLIRSVATSHDRFAHTGMLHYASNFPKIPVAALSPPDAEQLTRLLTQNGKVSLRLDLNCEFLEPTTTYNVIAEYDGAVWPEQYVQVGAHLDSWDEGTGALDDGAGLAIVTAATKQIIDLKVRPKRGIRLIYYAAEEIGLKGAKAFAKQYADKLGQIYLASESDFGAGPIYQLNTRFADPASPLTQALLNELAPLGIAAGHNAADGGPDTSVLVSEGVPALTLQQDGTDYFDYHHTANDTLDKVNPEHLQQNVAAWSVMLWVTTQSDVVLAPLAH